jgi:hypothetical protein
MVGAKGEVNEGWMKNCYFTAAHQAEKPFFGVIYGLYSRARFVGGGSCFCGEHMQVATRTTALSPDAMSSGMWLQQKPRTNHLVALFPAKTAPTPNKPGPAQ